MALRVLIIPDKFKGTLTALEAANALAHGWRVQRPQDDLSLLPMSDGGDGFGEIVSRLLEAKPLVVSGLDAAHRPCRVTWWWHESSATAVVESARIIGLAQLPPGKYHPFELDTEGLGNVLRAASEKGVRRVLVGIGGSATNDGGFGLARALGWRFFNKRENEIRRWTELHALAEVRRPREPLQFQEILVAVDVQNRLLGSHGCTRVYGPQKGLLPIDFDFAERCLTELAKFLARVWQLDYAGESGAGAAGGLGFGFRSFLGATLQPGFALFAEQAKLAERLIGTDLVLTGEGAIDASTLMGKGVGELANLCRQNNLPCVAFAGSIANSADAAWPFTQIYALTPDHSSKEEAMTRPGPCLEKLATKAAAAWHEG